jgi:hypothetical protein
VSPAAASTPPSEEELVAIMAAVELLWPRPVLEADVEESTNPWRFSGRWWARPVTARRARPWVDQGF